FGGGTQGSLCLWHLLGMPAVSSTASSAASDSTALLELCVAASSEPLSFPEGLSAGFWPPHAVTKRSPNNNTVTRMILPNPKTEAASSVQTLDAQIREPGHAERCASSLRYSASVCSPMDFHEKRSTARCRPAAPIALALAGSRASSLTRAASSRANASGSSGLPW